MLKGCPFVPSTGKVNAKNEKVAAYEGAFQAAASELERIINDPAFMRMRSLRADDLTEADKGLLERANAAAMKLSELRQERPRTLQV